MTPCSSLLFNATVASSAISAFFEWKLFDQLAECLEGISIQEYCREKKLDLSSFLSIIYALECFDIVRNENGLLKRGENFSDIHETQGYFHWMKKGYRHFLGNFPELMEIERREGQYFQRDGKAIALSGKDYGAKCIDSFVHDILKDLKIKKIADLGCGSADRLMKMADWARCEAVGIEINSDSVLLARELVQKKGKLSFPIIQADVSQLTYHAEFKEVDLITSFFMGHDLWPRQRCVEIFTHFQQVFPNVEYFLFCDTYQSQAAASPALPTFTLGFEVFHAMMGQYIPSVEEWRELFPQSGWNCIQEIETTLPFTNLFLLQRRYTKYQKKLAVWPA